MPCSLDLNIIRIVHVLSQPGFSAQNLPQLVFISIQTGEKNNLKSNKLSLCQSCFVPNRLPKANSAKCWPF